MEQHHAQAPQALAQGPGAAEINVTGNAQSIVDGDTTAAANDHTGFGTADITVGTVSRRFTIENIGTDTLTLGATATTLSGSNAADFSVISQPAGTVSASGGVRYNSISGARPSALVSCPSSILLRVTMR